jgi:hypothetical protein
MGKEREVLPGLQTGREEPPCQPSQQQQEKRLLEPQPKAERHEPGQPKGPAGEVEREAVMPPLEVQEEVPASGGPLPPQGSTLGVIDLTLDNSPSDKGKQKVDVAETLGGWPDFAELALVQAEELPRWGRSTLEFRDAANPNAEPFFALDDKDEVQHWEYIEGLHQHFVRSLRMVTDTLVR